MKYKGWIPVASGFLSFTNIRGQIIPVRCAKPPEIKGSFDDGHVPCVISSTRTLIDRPFGPAWAFVSSSDDKYDFECRATKIRDNGDDALTGVVIAHPRIESRGAELIKKESNIRLGVHKACLCWVIKFHLLRNGFVTLDWGDSPRADIAEIFDTSEMSLDEAERLLTFETFSFLKDLIHNHKFHSIDDDSIIVPVLVADDNDEQWKDVTAKNLHRAIVSSLRNTPARLELTNALGKLCYLRTFLQIADTNFCRRLLASFDNLERGIRARLEREAFESSGWQVFQGIWLSILLAAIATLITLFQLFQIPCIDGLADTERCASTFHIPPVAVQLTDSLLANWTGVALGLFGILSLIGYLASRKPIFDLYSQRMGGETWDWHLVRFFYGLALTQGKYLAFIWLTIFTFSMLGLLAYAIASLVR